jgi:hypothetical protein
LGLRERPSFQDWRRHVDVAALVVGKLGHLLEEPALVEAFVRLGNEVFQRFVEWAPEKYL